jgi:hypothetical protein
VGSALPKQLIALALSMEAGEVAWLQEEGEQDLMEVVEVGWGQDRTWGERGRIKALLCVTCTPCTQQRLDSTSL